MPDPFNIVFFGTPPFAVPALEAIHQSRHRVPLVVTQPDRPKGRGRKLVPPPVRTAAESFGYRVVQPESIKTESFAGLVEELKPDFLCVVAYGQLLPKALLKIPRFGALNIHPSLLPKYRGPAPIQWAIINGETETGVTIMTLDTGMDSGDILLRDKQPIHETDTAATLHDRLSQIGAELLVETIDRFSDGTIRPIPQDHSQATLAPLLQKSDGMIDWRFPAKRIHALVRGMDPWPGAFTFFQESRLKIFSVQPAEISEPAAPGTVIRGFQEELRVATGEGALSILEIQGASGKRLPIKQFLRGNPLPPGTIFHMVQKTNASN